MHKAYTNIVQIAGDVITIIAEDIGYNEIAEIQTRRGVSLAQVIRLDGKKVFLQVFAGSKGVSTGDKVSFLGHPMRVASGENLMGRIFNGSGRPLDKGPALSDNMIDIGGPPGNPGKKIISHKKIFTRIPPINLFYPPL